MRWRINSKDNSCHGLPDLILPCNTTPSTNDFPTSSSAYQIAASPILPPAAIPPPIYDYSPNSTTYEATSSPTYTTASSPEYWPSSPSPRVGPSSPALPSASPVFEAKELGFQPWSAVNLPEYSPSSTTYTPSSPLQQSPPISLHSPPTFQDSRQTSNTHIDLQRKQSSTGFAVITEVRSECEARRKRGRPRKEIGKKAPGNNKPGRGRPRVFRMGLRGSYVKFNLELT